MEDTVINELTDFQLLKIVTTELLKRSYSRLKKNEFPKDENIFGKAAPIATLEGIGRLLIALSQIEDGNAPPATALLKLSDVDMALMKTLASHARRRHLEQGRLELACTTPEPAN